MLTQPRKYTALATGGLLITIIAFGAGERARTQSDEGAYLPSGAAELRTGRELALIYIGSAGCRWSNAEGLSEAVERIKVALAQKAASAGWQFTATGVALDYSIQQGSTHLQRLGRFDEIIVGRSWLNSGAQAYVWRDLPGRAATPQLVLVARQVMVPERGSRGDHILVDEQLLARKVGFAEIQQWAESGTPQFLPTQ